MVIDLTQLTLFMKIDSCVCVCIKMNMIFCIHNVLYDEIMGPNDWFDEI